MAKRSSRPPARTTGVRPRGAGSQSVHKPGTKAGRGTATGGPVVSRAKTVARPARPAQSSRRGKPPDDVVANGQARRPLAAPTPNEKGPSPAVPSSLNLNRRPSAARSGRAGLAERYRAHHETSPGMTGGDVDADWESAYSVGDEAPGGDNPTPGQTVVEDVGRSLGVEYQDEEELKGAAKITSRDVHRWELDPASSEDYAERTKGQGRRRKKS
jgi:hypothetical protein